MKLRNLFSVAATGLLLTLAACSNEMLQDQSTQPEWNIKDGETRVTMALSGLGNGAVTARAASDIEVVEGENTIETLHVYSFINYTAANPGVETDVEDDYTLERIYTYEKDGDANDLALTPAGTGYEASFGVENSNYSWPRKRIFILVANDKQTRSLTAVASPSDDRSSATTIAAFKQLNILATDLTVNADLISTPLVMVATAQCVSAETGMGSHIYTSEDLTNGTPIAAELTRRVARIDIRNNATNSFTISSLILTGPKNSTLFGNPVESSNSNSPIAFAEKPSTSR